MRSLVIGGTRNLGPSIVQALLREGYEVAVVNRGQTPDNLPREVERLRADRTNHEQLKRALAGRDFDLVVDTTLYSGPEAEAVVELFSGRLGHYIFLSTGQVYLVRIGAERPYKEDDYPGPVMEEPSKSNAADHTNWVYGVEKRAAEDVLARAWEKHKFPFSSLRLPIVNSERDHYDRLYGYFLRLRDGGPVLVPDAPSSPLRHVYGDDVVQAIMKLAAGSSARGRAFNIGQDETLSLEQFLQLLAELMDCKLKVMRIARQRLEHEGLLPDCSPFSGCWMSSLDNSRSKRELAMIYTSVRSYLEKLVKHFQSAPLRRIEGYSRRAEELKLARSS